MNIQQPRFHGSQALPWLTLLTTATATGLWLWFGPAPEFLVFDRAAIQQGELWRLLTGHWVHADGEHALWDIGALPLIMCLMERQGRLRLALAALFGMLAVNVALWRYLPELERYCGLSGMLNTLLVVMLADLWRRQPHPIYILTALLLGLKLLLEITLDQSLLLDTPWPAVPLTHLAGCCGGLLLLGLERFVPHKAWSQTPPNRPEAPTMPAETTGDKTTSWTAAKPSNKSPPKPRRGSCLFPPAPRSP